MPTPSARLRRETAVIAQNYPRCYPVTVHTKVRNGFPVIAMGAINPADPSVGIFNPCIEDVVVVTPDWRYADFLKLTKAELASIEADLMAAANARN